MSVLVVETYVVRTERRDDYDPALASSSTSRTATLICSRG